MEPILIQEVCKTLPREFVSELNRIVPHVYRESFSAAQGDWGKETPEAKYMYPYIRRSNMEKAIRELAEKFGLEVKVRSNRKGTYQYTQIKAGVFLLTCSYLNGYEERMLRGAIFRKSNASLNRYLAQLPLQGLEEFFENEDDGKLNAIILHGANRKDVSQLEFLQLAFPAVDNKSWAARIEFSDLMTAYPVEITTPADDVPMVQLKSAQIQAQGQG